MGMDKWTLWHVGLSVKNIDEAVKYYKSLGGTVQNEEPGHVLDSANFKEFRSYNDTNPKPWKIKIKMASLGPLMLELTEPVEGDNYNVTWMNKHGEGANHIAFQVDDLAAEVKELEDKGVPAMYYAKGAYAYMDARKVGGMVIELFQKRTGPPPARPPQK
jgi:methylmalonyl-CoA/ethylmalonyl-CoA epimerase